MVDPTELRIGNWLLYQGNLTQVQVVSNGVVVVDAYSEAIPCSSDDIQPIYLNDFLLSQLFPRNDERSWLIARNALWTLDGEDDDYCIMMHDKSNRYHITPGRIKTYHQLQNASYAMLGYETTHRSQTLQVAFRTTVNLGKYTFLDKYSSQNYESKI